MAGTDQINNNYYSTNWSADGCEAKFDQLVLVNRNTSAINIYLLDDNTWNQGKAESIPGLALVIGGKILGAPIVPSRAVDHELGHCLNLFHTFHGCESGPDCSGNSTAVCLELPNSSNCTTCGDFVCDTPADPFINFNTTGCSWNGTAGSPLCVATGLSASDYSPDATNIMTYVPVNCMTHITEGQADRIRTELLRTGSILNAVRTTSTATPILSNVQLNSNAVTGPMPVSSGSSYTMQVNVPSNPNPVTSISFSNIGGTGSMAVSLTPSGNSCSIYVTGSIGSRYIRITATNSCGTSTRDVVLYIPSSFKVYPNPAKDILTLEFPNTETPEALPDQIDLYNENSSQPIKSVSVQEEYNRNDFKNDNKIYIDVKSLPRGTYYLHVTSGKNSGQKIEKTRILLE